jgi:hypothetical protein
MTNEMLIEVACPNCHSPIDVREHGRYVTCEACRNQYLLRGHFCYRCNHYHEADAAVCAQCGTILSRVCRKCHTANWAGDEYCRHCASPMDILDSLDRYQRSATADRLSQQMSEATHLKKVEEQASQRHMAEMMALEETRQAELFRRRKQRQQQERTILIGALLFAGLLLMGLALYLVWIGG